MTRIQIFKYQNREADLDNGTLKAAKKTAETEQYQAPCFLGKWKQGAWYCCDTNYIKMLYCRSNSRKYDLSVE